VSKLIREWIVISGDKPLISISYPPGNDYIEYTFSTKYRPLTFSPAEKWKAIELATLLEGRIQENVRFAN
jgi:hypothetical protein